MFNGRLASSSVIRHGSVVTPERAQSTEALTVDSHLLDAGLLMPAEDLVLPRPRLGQKHYARLEGNGTIALPNGTLCTSPSLAAMKAADLVSYDGWHGWRFRASTAPNSTNFASDSWRRRRWCRKARRDLGATPDVVPGIFFAQRWLSASPPQCHRILRPPNIERRGAGRRGAGRLSSAVCPTAHIGRALKQRQSYVP